MIVDWLHVSPPLNFAVKRYMLETVDVHLRVKSAHPASNLRIQAWTNLPTRFNSDGNWYAIDIPCLGHAEDGSVLFQNSLLPTNDGEFELTYRAFLSDNPEQIQWMGNPGDNVFLQVEPPSPYAGWTQFANHVEVMPGVYVGNFISASQAEALGIDAVLNMAEELNPTFTGEGAIAYLKLPCRDGSQHPIPDEYLQEAIAWIDQQLAEGKQKVLVHCRAGIGRSGSVGVAYCSYKHPHWSYTEVLDYVWSKKPDVYPHTQLQQSLERLFARKSSAEL